MINNNTPSKAEALQALAFIEDIWDLAPDLPYTKKLRAFISGAPDNQPQGELNATRLDTNDRATAGNRGARPDLQHIARDGHEPGSSGVESHPLRGGDGMVVGDITPSTRPGCAGVHLPLDASAASAPLGWLYDWTHSSALGKPDERFTSFTTDEAHARKHDNPRPVWGAPDAANAGGPVAFRLPVADIVRGAIEAIEAGDRAPILMNVEGIKANLRSLIATPTGVAADESTRAPDGWKLVPVKPTNAMLEAAYKAFMLAAPSLIGFNAKERAYKALLQHAPAPPSGERPSAPAPTEESRNG